jgi:hypothetical protein
LVAELPNHVTIWGGFELIGSGGKILGFAHFYRGQQISWLEPPGLSAQSAWASAFVGDKIQNVAPRCPIGATRTSCL